MFQRILVPLDGSDRAERAIAVAANIARAIHGSIVLLRVIPNPTHLDLLSVDVSKGPQNVLEKQQDEIKHYLAELAVSEALEGVETITEVVYGEPAEGILSVANGQQADLILMYSHGHTGFKRWVLGSVAQKVAWHSTAPVLIVRESSQRLSGLSSHIGHPIRALVALDGSPFTEAALIPAAQLVATCSSPAQGELHLTHLVKLPSLEEEMAYLRLGIAIQRRVEALYQADQYLQGIKERLASEMNTEFSVNITCSVEECTDVAETLLKMALGEGEDAHTPSDLIALTTHGGSGLHRWIKGSVAERVLNSATIPLLIVHPQQHAH
jgi:nucleotide-binding universal stress UspA family protein